MYAITDNGGSLSFLQTDSHVLTSESFSVHNPMIIGNRLYVSWWQAGMLAFDLDTQTGTLDFIARYDTCPCDVNGPGLGAFGVYPFLGDDNILVSDLEFGLFVVDLFPTGDKDIPTMSTYGLVLTTLLLTITGTLVYRKQ